MNDEIAISVKNLSKDFVLPHQKKNSVKSVFTNMFSLGDKTFEVQHALKDISFEVKKGEFFGIVGRNGSGKSTLLKILAGIYQPSKGTVSTKGRIVPFIELGVGFNGELTGRENVYLNGALLGFSEKEINDKYDEIVGFAELERFMDQKLKNYSSGMQVRLAFSVATILAESDILLIDEVLAVGDADFQRKCFDYFRRIKKQKKTVIFVSHDMNSIKEYCDRAVLINLSEKVLEGSASSVAEEYYKQFSTSEEISKDVSTNDRWGAGSVKIIDKKLNKYSLANATKNLAVTLDIVSDQAIEDAVVGFAIYNRAGLGVIGTNTKIETNKLLTLEKNKVSRVEWSVPNIFADGKYEVTLAVTDSSGSVVYDWWNKALFFEVRKNRSVPYPIQVNIKTLISKVKK